MILVDNLQRVREEVAKYGDIALVAATKTQSAETIAEFCALAPEFILGENRVQELTEKYISERVWHMIGRLQTNKVKYVVPRVDVIQSLDREELAVEIEKQATKLGKVQKCLIEVNMGFEASKGGIEPDELEKFMLSTAKYEHICIAGLMSVLPNIGEGAELDALYKKLYRLFEKAKGVKTPNADIKYLSAGMSNDYRTALDNGSNMIRLGRVLFGERNYDKNTL